MFDAIVRRYDLLNRLLSMGMDRRWRRRAVAALSLGAGDRALDVGVGTADIALEALRRHPDTRVVGVDPARRMMERGRAKAVRRGLSSRLTLVAGDASRLPFATGVFAGAAIAFGIRNIPGRVEALREMGRVVRTGGRVVVLELTAPRRGLLAPLARLWVHGVVPLLGAVLSSRGAYRYLRDSMRDFPPPQAFAALMAEAGLRVVQVHPLCAGTAHLFVGQVA